MGLRSLPQSGLGELFDSLRTIESASAVRMNTERSHIFLAILVSGQMNSAKGSTAYLLLDNVLIDTMFCNTVVFACDILGSCIEGFLCKLDQSAP